MSLIFDIESEPLPDDELRARLPPFDESQFVVTEFNPSTVKLGNLKDPEKIAEKLTRAEQEHVANMASIASRLSAARDAHWNDFIAESTLNPGLSRVLCIAYCNAETEKAAIDWGDECDMLRRFWAKFETCRTARRRMFGCNIFGFDLPFMIRRSWINDIDVPVEVSSTWKHRITWNDLFCDIQVEWQMGSYRDKCSFDHIGRAFGTGGKSIVGCSGADTWRVWRTNRPLAIEYVLNDVIQPVTWIRKMGLV